MTVDRLSHPKQLLENLKKSHRLRIAEELRRRNFTGVRLLQICGKFEEWEPKRLERLFDFTENEAIRVLVNAGYEPGEGGFWRKSKSRKGEAPRQAMDKIETDAWDDLDL